MTPWSISEADHELLIISGLLDAERYRADAGLSDEVDIVTHYLERGWLDGLEPRAGFDGCFLRPYYEAAGRYGPPGLIWIELSAMLGHRAPTNQIEAEWLAGKFRDSPFFDASFYAERLGPGLDPAIHYAVVGELLGWQPSKLFDPGYYLEQDDIAKSALSPLGHYIDFGHREGRKAVPSTTRLRFPPLVDGLKPTVLIVVHEASRTGAPLLGWNIVKRLAKSYNVVSVLMRGGPLEQYFVEDSAVVIGPLVWEEWQPTEIRYVAGQLVANYHPLYVITNSVETHLLVPALAKLGVPAVALVHEFAAYTRPVARMRDVLDWATHVVFPAALVADSCFSVFPSFACRRGVHVLSQGPVELPRDRPNRLAVGQSAGDDIGARVRPGDATSTFVVLGLGNVQIRKGVDLFLAAAASAQRLAPEIKFRFVWIGDGFDPIHDSAYSVYISEQIARSGLTETTTILDAVEDLDRAYANADMFFMSSRLDPQPNVGIDAVTRGIPTVCFEGASGTAEVLQADAETKPLVAPHLDAHAAAEVICRFARDRGALDNMRIATARVGAAAFDMESYVTQIDNWGRESASSLLKDDLRTLADGNLVDPELVLPPHGSAPGPFGVERYVLQQWSVVKVSQNQTSNIHFRRPCAGFHPQAYAEAHPRACIEGASNPLAHWVRAGRPPGPWSRPVFSPLDARPQTTSPLRVALHAHFYYVENAGDLAARLAINKTPCDLFLSTDTEHKASHLEAAFARHRGAVDLRVLPNSGRDIGPLLTGLSGQIVNGGYDVFGHVHGKRSPSNTGSLGNRWREFLWENLIGGAYPMLDLAIATFTTHSEIGLLMAEDPHLVGWDKNRSTAEALADRMGIHLPLDDFFDFPLGTMFWTRPESLLPLIGLGLTWESYPAEPLMEDGTLLHAIERLVPYATRRAGLIVAGLRAPTTTW